MPPVLSRDTTLRLYSLFNTLNAVFACYSLKGVK